MKKLAGIVLAVLGGLIILAIAPFLVHALVNAFFVLLLRQPVPGWWWALVGPIQNLVALPIVAFAFVIKMGPTLSLVLPVVVELVLAALGIALLWAGLRVVRRARTA